MVSIILKLQYWKSLDNEDDLLLKERFYIEQLKPTLNTNIPYRTDEEKERNKYNKEWYEHNKEKNKEERSKYDKEYREQNKDKIKEYHKERYEANKEKFKEIHKKYREANREKINEKKNARVICECGSEVSRNSLQRHRKTKKHLDIMKMKLV